jgi:hypothetical protein
MGYAGYFKLNFAALEWLYLFSLLGWEPKDVSRNESVT